MTKRLARMKVLGLFGLFDHEIIFNLDEHITILHAPNGFGKTVMLKLIAAFFGGTSRIFTEVEFREIRFDLSDGSQVYIYQNTGEEERSYRIVYSNTTETKEYDTSAPSDSPDERHRAIIPSNLLQQYLPFLRPVRPGLFRDLQSGRQIGYRQVLDLYWKELPPRLRSRRGQPDWLRELRASVHCRLIETQRLLKVEPRETGYDSGNPTLIPVVRSHAEALQSLIRQRLAESATLSQTLDRTFPARLIRKQIPALSESHLRERLTALEARRERLMNAGLLEKSEDNAFIPWETFDDSTRQILSEYVGDAEQKLSIFNDLLSRIELLTDVINSHFQFKRLVIDSKKGLTLRDVSDREISLDSLSSGEQHELVLVYDLLFGTQQGTLLLIDEPEISLHIAWQKKFIPDLQRITELVPMDVLISTHSPQLIGSYMDLAVHLQGPESVRSSF